MSASERESLIDEKGGGKTVEVTLGENGKSNGKTPGHTLGMGNDTGKCTECTRTPFHTKIIINNCNN